MHACQYKDRAGHPLLGRESDTLLNTNAIALGYPVLALEDGTRLSHSFESLTSIGIMTI